MNDAFQGSPPLEHVIENLNVGLFIVNRDFEVVLWNRFMAVHSGKGADEVVGRNLFDVFPELPRRWLQQKLRSVFLLKNAAFTAWEQRPYLFKFPHNRPITGGVDSMRQNCTFQPIEGADGEVAYVCVSIFDMTDASIYQEKLQETKRELEEISVRDGLTRLFNRRYLEDCLYHEFDRVRRYGGQLSVIILDIDHFKYINDSYGHPAGDAVLIHLASVLKDNLRASDIAGRYGGEEFAILLPNTDPPGAARLTERIRAHIAAEPPHHDAMTVPFSVSIGIAGLTDQVADPEALIKNADLALYYAKENGRDRAIRHDQMDPADLPDAG
jgi:diguanylate cyclase (GGDEF)-like protein